MTSIRPYTECELVRRINGKTCNYVTPVKAVFTFVSCIDGMWKNTIMHLRRKYQDNMRLLRNMCNHRSVDLGLMISFKKLAVTKAFNLMGGVVGTSEFERCEDIIV